MKVQFVVQQHSGISYHRLINPMEFMKWDSEEDSAEMLWIHEDEHKVNGDILYFNKFIAMDKSQLEVVKKKGIKIIVDIDDSWDLPINHIFYDMWTKLNNTKRVLDAVKLADLVICTTMRLQDKIRPYNKNTAVVPNAFPFGYDTYKPMPVEHEKMGFIYVAGSTHLPDVELLRGKFKRIGSDSYIKSNAEFMLAGYEESKGMRYKTKEDLLAKNGNYNIIKVRDVWDKMATIFSETGSYKIIPSTNLDEYINFYDQADVALIPLCNTDWNSYKSELKIVEAACKGLPVICSRVLPYSTLYGKEGIMWVERPDDWLTHIKYCIKNPNYVKDMGEKLSTWVKESYDLLIWNETRKQLFKSILR
jgi:glycosyltransferase involved in cell wall biosynthesis